MIRERSVDRRTPRDPCPRGPTMSALSWYFGLGGAPFPNRTAATAPTHMSSGGAQIELGAALRTTPTTRAVLE